FFQAEDGIRDATVTGVQTCALPISKRACPRQEWIEIAVPALVSQASFELAQERLEFNKKLSARRTKEPSVLQGLLVCAQCGYARSEERRVGEECGWRCSW